MSMKTCPACAAENSESSQSCSGCGISLEATLAATVVATNFKQSRRPEPASESDSSIHGRFLPGTKIANRYRIVSLAGRGGMGEVYRADDFKAGTSRGFEIPAAGGQGGFPKFPALFGRGAVVAPDCASERLPGSITPASTATRNRSRTPRAK
jgi:hypothetical protein